MALSKVMTATAATIRGEVTMRLSALCSSVFWIAIILPSALWAQPTTVKAFGAASILLNQTTSLTITITNPSGIAMTGVGFTDTFLAPMVVATPSALTNTCGGTATGTAASGALTLSGGTLAANSSCVVSVNVTAPTVSIYPNSTGPVTSSQGNGTAATATLDVLGPPAVSKQFFPANIPVGGTSTLTVSIITGNQAPGLTGVGLVDNLPAGLVVATPNNLSGNCPGPLPTATAGSSTITLVGGQVGIDTFCSFSVNVTGTTAGTKNNVTNNVTSDQGTGNMATASLGVGLLAPPTISKAFGAANIPLNGTTSLSFTVTNPNAAAGNTGVGFTDTLPPGLIVATPNGATGTCITINGAVVTAVAGSGSVSMALPLGFNPSGSCSFSVNVTGTTVGTKNNTTSAVTSVEGGNGNTASASLGVGVLTPPTLTKVFGAANVALNGTTSLTFTVTNPNAAASLSGVGFTDNLPAGLIVATPNGVAGTCLTNNLGVVTAAAGSGTVTLASALFNPNQSCSFTVNVTITSAGSLFNTTGAVTSVEAGAGNTATASLNVATAIPTLSSAALGGFTLLLAGLGWVLLRKVQTPAS
jgi:hypothetical protein